MGYFNKEMKMNLIKQFELLGFIQGDGSITDMNNADKKGININVGKDDVDISNYFNLGLENGQINVYYNWDLNTLSKIVELDFVLKILPERSLPRTFENWESELQRAFMRGLYSANGYALKNYGRIGLKTTCKQLAEEVRDYFKSVGVSSYITTNKPKRIMFENGEYLCRESYDVNLSRSASRRWFMNNIGFIHQYKNERAFDNI